MEISDKHKQILYTIFAASGCSALIYEVLWTKYLSLTFGNTMIAVSVVAATFMAGLAIGSFLLGRYVDHEGHATENYPLNPNGSPEGLTGFCSDDGRSTIMMPHPERVFRAVQHSWHPDEWQEDAPWMRLFRNARVWVS